MTPPTTPSPTAPRRSPKPTSTRGRRQRVCPADPVVTRYRRADRQQYPCRDTGAPRHHLHRPPPVQHHRAAAQRVQQCGHQGALRSLHRPDSRSSQHQGPPPIRPGDLRSPPPLGRHHPPDNQVDLANNIEIITAHRRFQRLLCTVDDPTWARQQLWRTTGIVTDWHYCRDRHSVSHAIVEELHARWDKRAETLPSAGSATSLLAMPEAVAVAEILCDLEWRRHVAKANDYDLGAVLPAGRPAPRTAGENRRPARLLLPARPAQEVGYRVPQTVPNHPRPVLESITYSPALQPTVSLRHPSNNPPRQVRDDDQGPHRPDLVQAMSTPISPPGPVRTHTTARNGCPPRAASRGRGG